MGSSLLCKPLQIFGFYSITLFKLTLWQIPIGRIGFHSEFTLRVAVVKQFLKCFLVITRGALFIFKDCKQRVYASSG